MYMFKCGTLPFQKFEAREEIEIDMDKFIWI